jgi:hypothetical protein
MRIFGPKRDKIIGGWRKLHSEKFHNLHSVYLLQKDQHPV